MTWEPGETAPRDGRNFVAFYERKFEARPDLKLARRSYLRLSLAAWSSPWTGDISSIMTPDPNNGAWRDGDGEEISPILWLDVPDVPEEVLQREQDRVEALNDQEWAEVSAAPDTQVKKKPGLSARIMRALSGSKAEQ